MSGNDRFNAEAAAWDANPDVHRASEGALQALLTAIPNLPSQSARVLELGCGTGLLSLRLAPYVSSILAIDAAEGMIDALEMKLAQPEHADLRNKIQPLCIMLEDPEDKRLPPADTSEPHGPRAKYDLIVSHLVLHHIADLAALLKTMYGCLQPGGEVALTDYEDFGPDARKFHPESKMFGVERHGIDANWFTDVMRDEVGFVDVDVSPKWTMEKEVERSPGEWGASKPQRTDLATMEFPFLLCRGKRPSQ